MTVLIFVVTLKNFIVKRGRVQSAAPGAVFGRIFAGITQ